MWKVQPSWAVQSPTCDATLVMAYLAAIRGPNFLGVAVPVLKPNVSLGTDGEMQEGVPSPNGRS